MQLNSINSLNRRTVNFCLTPLLHNFLTAIYHRQVCLRFDAESIRHILQLIFLYNHRDCCEGTEFLPRPGIGKEGITKLHYGDNILHSFSISWLEMYFFHVSAGCFAVNLLLHLIVQMRSHPAGTEKLGLGKEGDRKFLLTPMLIIS